MEDTQLSLFGKTSQEPCPVTRAKTSAQSSKASRVPQTQAPLFLDLRGNGGPLGPCWETDGLSLGEYTTHSFWGSPSAAVESRLSWILMDIVDPKYYLSAKACLGILRRAERRGKKLPPILEEALRYQAEHYKEIIVEIEILWKQTAA